MNTFNIYHQPWRATFNLVINIDQVEKLYIGKEGCRCGCIGHYHEPGDKHFNRFVTETLEWMERGSLPVESFDINGKTFCLEVKPSQDSDRVRTIYIKEEYQPIIK